MRQIPRGRVTTYGDLAEALGDLAAARWVGEYLRSHPHEDDCPCHRVVRRTGEAGLYAGGGETEKLRRLGAEGVPLSGGKIELARCRFTDFRSTRPLVALAEYQKQLPRRIELTPWKTLPETVAGVDVSYQSGGEAVAAYALLDRRDATLLYSASVRRPVRFPYISSYLAFREIPLHLELLERVAEAGRLAEVLIVDGHGILHPRGAGIAAHLGVAADLATVGVGKKLLCGRVDESVLLGELAHPVVREGEVIGAAMRSTAKSRPVYVSPGNRNDLASAVRLLRTLFRGHRLPEPIHQADRLSRTA